MRRNGSHSRADVAKSNAVPPSSQDEGWKFTAAGTQVQVPRPRLTIAGCLCESNVLYVLVVMCILLLLCMYYCCMPIKNN